MFTGLIKDIGKIKSVMKIPEGIELVVESKLAPEIHIDDSVAINGACQTAVAVNEKSFKVQAVQVTLDKTTLGTFKNGDQVNLELAMALGERMGGHMVQGHVNDVTSLKSIVNKGDNYILEFDLPENGRKYVVKEGSIAVNGISLTVSHVNDFSRTFSVSIIPHTFKQTILSQLKTGDKVNLEYDIIAKYVENMLINSKNKQPESKITEEWLNSKGY